MSRTNASSCGRKFTYYGSCVELSGRKIQEMKDEAREITYKTFRRHCEGIDNWAAEHGYADHPSRGMTLAQDAYVRYFKSKYNGKPCYFLVYSAIEFIWV